VPPAEVEPLARAIVELARDPARAARMGQAGRQRALEHFLEDRATDRTEVLYRAFLDGSID
jgi:starch synthase